MPRKKLPISRLKNKAWDVVSKWVRFTAANEHGIVLCVTCDSKHFWKDIQAGHFIHGHAKPTFLVLMNVHPQCVQCNHFKSGNLEKYREFMVKQYGEGSVEALRQLSHKIWKPTRDELEGIITKYNIAEEP